VRSKEFVDWWTDEDAEALSVAFVTAFGNELTPRLDLVQELRSRRLPAEDIAWLRSLTPQVAFDHRLIRTDNVVGCGDLSGIGSWGYGEVSRIGRWGYGEVSLKVFADSPS